MATKPQKWAVRKDIYKAIDQNTPPPAPVAGDPEWINAGAEAQSRGGSRPYETGDPDIDNYNRARRTGQVPQDDPFRHAYDDPAEMQRIVSGAYRAGASGDRGPEAIINGPYANTPLGRLMKRAYVEGQRSRGGR